MCVSGFSQRCRGAEKIRAKGLGLFPAEAQSEGMQELFLCGKARCVYLLSVSAAPEGRGCLFEQDCLSPSRCVARPPPLHWCGGSGVAVRWCYLGHLGVGYFMR